MAIYAAMILFLEYFANSVLSMQQQKQNWMFGSVSDVTVVMDTCTHKFINIYVCSTLLESWAI